MNIKQMLEKTASEVPQKTAIVCGSRRVSYQELDQVSNRVANALTNLGVNKGDHVAILTSYSPEWLISYFGIVKAGGITVLLNSMLKAPELAFLLHDSDSQILLTERKFAQMLASHLSAISSLKHVIEVDSDSYAEKIANSSSISPVVDIKEEDETAIIYTSGVLGKQKGAVHTHASLVRVVSDWDAEYRKEDINISPIPFFTALGLTGGAFASIMDGATLVIFRFTPRAMLEAIEQERGTIIQGVPGMYNAINMLDDETFKKYNLPPLRMATIVGAKSSPGFLERLESKLNVTFCEIYGLTECLVVSRATIHDRKLGMAGKPVYDVKIVDDEGKEVSQGEIGEAIVRNPTTMKGYYKMPDLTAQVLKDGWFYTGDLVRLDQAGYLEYIEKKSFVIVTSAGVKIPPTEVEDVLLSHPSVAEAAYVGVTDVHKGQIPTAFIVLKEGQSATTNKIRSFCRQSLADYKLPHKIKFVDSIPRTGSGKIDRRQLKEMKTS